MSAFSRRLPALLAGSALFSLCGLARAAPCGRPDIDLTFPPNDAAAVPANALFAAHYAAPAIYDGEQVDITDAAGNAVAVTVTYDEADSMLHATPDQALDAGTYDIVWPGLRGVSGSGGVGRGSTTSVTVTSTTDVASPVFAGLTDIEWDLSRDRDPCLDKLDDRFVFKLDVGQGSDDAPVEFLALRVFQTKDPLSPAQSGPSTAGLRAWPKDGVLEVRRPATKAGQTCFAAIAQDLLGRVSGGGEHEVCLKTKKPPFFDGCAVALPGSGAPFDGLRWGFVLLGLGLVRRGRSADARKPRAD
jgi:hypothetical protein